ncbi:DUF6531 domain-containing protein, partial [Microbulbifer litoralis]|uniref:DUF6531 domain-containing protein n=1 Tax=Microbulbifer litoralis TaxID=2933965 RepID=UPI002027BD4B
MQLIVESRAGIRYRVSRGWSYDDGITRNRAALQLLSSFDDRALDRIYEQFFGVENTVPRSLLLDTAASSPGILSGPYLDAPGLLPDRHKEIYLALLHNRLTIEESPLSAAELADGQSVLRMKIRMGLQRIIAEERAEAARIQTEHEQRNPLEKVGAYVGRYATGFGQQVWGLALWAKDVAEVAALVSPLRQSFQMASAATDYYVHGKSVEESLRENHGNLWKEVVDVLGFDPTDITFAQLQQAYDVAELVCEDTALRSAITQFARDYVDAQHSLEIAEFAGAGAFEIVLTIVLAAATGGVGAAGAMAKNARLLGRFRGIGELMLEFAGKQRQRQALRRNAGAQTDGTSFSDLETVEAEAPANSGSQPAPARSGGSGTNGGSQSGSGPDSAVEPATTDEPDRTGSATGTNQNGDSSQCNANACEGGEPINLKTGEERLTLVDAVLDGPLPLTMARTYRSSNHKDFGFGYGWTHTLGERLEWRGDKQPLQLHDAEGRVISLPAPGGSGRSHNVVEQLSLTRAGKGHWIVSPYGAPEGMQKHFRALEAGDGILALSEIRDGYGNFYRFHYVGRDLICVESSLGEALHIKPVNGRIGELKKETADGQISTLATYEYSDEGDLVHATDADGHSEQYRYSGHLIAQRTLKSGYSFHFEWDAEGPGARCLRQWGDPIDGQPTYSYQFEWDDDGRGVTVTDTRGGRERYRFNERALPIYHRDAEGGETLYTYNELGQLTDVQLPTENGVPRVEHYEYDSGGRLIGKTDLGGGRHYIDYNDQGLPQKITNAAGQSWQRRYNAGGQVTASTDPLGNTTEYSYNPLGLVGSVTDPLGNTTRYLWNPQGRLAAVHDAMGRSRHYRYDVAQRLAEVQHGPGQSTRYEYDRQDRISAVISPDGARTQYRYNAQGLVAEIVDAEERSTRYEYDGLSQVRARTNPDGSRLQYHYDGERNLVGLTNENGERYQLKYDLSERLVEEVGFDGRTTRYAYNNAGHLVSSRAVTDPDSGRGIDTVFERDPFGRLLQETTPDGVTSFRYNRAGQLLEAENAHRKLRWEYDAGGRVIGDWQGGAEMRHRYDAAGRRTTSRLPDGEVLSFGYNLANQFDSLHRRAADGDTDELLTVLDHDDLGREIRRQHGNGLASERDYDPQGRLHKVRLGKADGPVENPLLERGYR